ncbi:GRAB protein, partial [Eubucco bourcierii]|nr:GRAB protein [Eubucco bourcierii]
YVAYLQGRDNHSCGGFLVAPNWVMTAAQCSAHKPLTVILGAHTAARQERSWQIFEVQEYHCHPNFTNPKKGNDILLLKLKGNATSNSYLSFEKLIVKRDTKCRVLGWGHQAPNGTLREATVTIVDERNCLSYYPWRAANLVCGKSGSAGVPEKVSLTSHTSPLMSLLTSQSDAGDPLICNNKAYGIFSYKHSTWPGFYTRIAPYLAWIKSVMK